jgi:uncharacterized membrane protein
MKRILGVAGAALALSCALTPARAGEAAAAPEAHGFGERIAARLRGYGLSDPLIVATVAALPVVELRGAIPIGNNFLGMKDRWWRTLLIAIAGNMVPVPFIIWFLGPISRFFMRFPAGKRFFEWLFARTRKKTAEIEKYETLGLAIFVAIPLPATGAWTGAMCAWLLDMEFRHAMWSIALGVAIAGVIMTVLSLLGWIGATIAGVALIALAVGALLRMFRGEKPAA